MLALQQHTELLRCLVDATVDRCCGHDNSSALRLDLSQVLGPVTDFSVTLPLTPGSIVILENLLSNNTKVQVLSNTDAHAAVASARPLSLWQHKQASEHGKHAAGHAEYSCGKGTKLIEAWFAHSSQARCTGLLTVAYNLDADATTDIFLGNVLLLASMMTPYLTSKLQQRLLETATAAGVLTSHAPGTTLEYAAGIGFVLAKRAKRTAFESQGTDSKPLDQPWMLPMVKALRMHRTSSNWSIGSNTLAYDNSTGDMETDDVIDGEQQEEELLGANIRCHKPPHRRKHDDDEEEEDDASAGNLRRRTAASVLPTTSGVAPEQSSDAGQTSTDNADNEKQHKQQDAQQVTAEELAVFAQHPWSLTFENFEAEMDYVAHMMTVATMARRAMNVLPALLGSLYVAFQYPYQTYYCENQWNFRATMAITVMLYSLQFLPAGWPRLPSIRPYGLFMLAFISISYPFVQSLTAWLGIIQCARDGRSSLPYTIPMLTLPYVATGVAHMGSRFVMAAINAVVLAVLHCIQVLPTLCAVEFAAYPWALPVGVVIIWSMTVLALRCKYIRERCDRAEWQAQELAARR